MKDYYKILEVNETASAEVIQAAYKILAKKYHPDHAKPNEKAMKEARMKEINNAKEVLLNPKEREKYDILLRQEKERQNQEIIESKVERHRETQQKRQSTIRNNQNKKKKYKTNDSAADAVFGAFWGFGSLFANRKENKDLIIICSALFFIAFSFVIFAMTYAFNPELFNFENANKKINVIEPNETSIEEVIDMFGNPSYKTDEYLEYGNAKILIDEEVVVGWIDTYGELDILKHEKLPAPSDISIGMAKSAIIKKWGLPDSYSENIIVYHNMIITFVNDEVISVDKIK